MTKENNDLILRYIYAVTKHLPSKIRNDVDSELKTLIDDMLEARCKDTLPTLQDVKVVLTELGTPTELAQKYISDTESYLIGPKYFTQYKSLLTLVLIAVAGAITIAHVILAFLEPPTNWLKIVGDYFGTLIITMTSIFTFFTLITAILERKGIAFNLSNDSLDSLPPLPNKKELIPKGECYVGIVVSVILAVVLIFLPHVITVPISFNGTQSFVLLLNTQLFTTFWYLVVFIALLGIAREVFSLVEGRYTKRYALVVIVANTLNILLTISLLSNGSVFSREFLAAINTAIGGSDAYFVVGFFYNFNSFLIGIMILAVAINVGTAIYKGFKYDYTAKIEKGN